jgi:predicted kinase
MAILLKNLLNEGPYDKGVLKCVFTAGGPGSGKSYAISDIFGLPKGASLTGLGLKVVNSDAAFETFLRKNGIDPKELGRIKDENPAFYSTVIDTGEGKTGSGIRQIAMRMSSKARRFYAEGRLGMIVDGTGANPEFIRGRKEETEAWGYDTAMIFVDTTLEVALERNRLRDRSLSDHVVRELWGDCQHALNEYRSMFGKNLYIIENSGRNPVDSSVKKAIRRFVDGPVANPVGKKWLEQALLMRKHL